MTTNETWLEVMPAIPLERGVCVRSVHSEAIDIVIIGGGTRWRLAFSGWQDASDWRADLSTANSFGYAWRWLHAQCGYTSGDHGAEFRVVQRWICGETTDADRDALAAACAEVSP